MADEGKGLGLVILGIVAVIAVVGLVLMFMGAKGTGKVAVQSARMVDGGSGYGNENQILGEGNDLYWADRDDGRQAPSVAADRLVSNEAKKRVLSDTAFKADDLRANEWPGDAPD